MEQQTKKERRKEVRPKRQPNGKQQNNKLRDHKTVKIKVEDFINHEDSINRKAQQRERSAMAVPSDDRNGVVVNRAIDSTRGIPKQLVEERCKEKQIAVRRLVQKMSTAVVPVPYVQC